MQRVELLTLHRVDLTLMYSGKGRVALNTAKEYKGVLLHVPPLIPVFTVMTSLVVSLRYYNKEKHQLKYQLLFILIQIDKLFAIMRYIFLYATFDFHMTR